MSALVSIIIPFYNEEQYLPKAIDSAINQSYTTIEIILVNDGSTDNSLTIAEEYLGRYNNIQLTSVENRGLGNARNIGMSLAKGAYLTFLDSDDELCRNAIEAWVEKIQAEQAEIVVSRFNMINRNHAGKPVMVAGWKGDGLPVSGDDGVQAMYEYRMSSTAWAKLYITRIARQLKFPVGLWFEDRPFLLQYLMLVRRIAYVPEGHINILSREGSITRRLVSARRIKDAYAIYLLELKAVSDHRMAEKFTRFIDRHQINAMIETLIIIYFDRKNHPEIKSIENCYTRHVQLFIGSLARNGSRIGWRDTADLLLLRLPEFLGWRFTYWLLPVWKKKKCRSVLYLKSF